MRIDPHVHCRDGQESYKGTIAHVLRLCDQQGVAIIFDMPNTDPPLLTPAAAVARLKLVPAEARDRYRIYLGLSAEPAQVWAAAASVNQLAEVIGLKLYAGGGSGALAVSSEQEQQLVYQTLAEAGYRGVLAVHCEKEALLVKAFDPRQPTSHASARPAQAEVQSIADQIRWAKTCGFEGTLHICHLSTAAGLQLIEQEKMALAGGAAPWRITCGVTPHHLLWSLNKSRGAEGLIYKVNPPLREPADTIALRRGLKEGSIDWLESDHAPHPLCEKLYAPYASGYPALCLYRRLVEELLPAWGLDAERIGEVTGGAVRRVFDERKLKR